MACSLFLEMKIVSSKWLTVLLASWNVLRRLRQDKRRIKTPGVLSDSLREQKGKKRGSFIQTLSSSLAACDLHLLLCLLGSHLLYLEGKSGEDAELQVSLHKYHHPSKPILTHIKSSAAVPYHNPKNSFRLIFEHTPLEQQYLPLLTSKSSATTSATKSTSSSSSASSSAATTTKSTAKSAATLKFTLWLGKIKDHFVSIYLSILHGFFSCFGIFWGAEVHKPKPRERVKRQSVKLHKL